MDLLNVLLTYQDLGGDVYNRDICIRNRESDLYIGRNDTTSIWNEFKEDYGQLMDARVLGLKHDTTAISGSEEVNIGLEITIVDEDFRSSEL